MANGEDSRNEYSGTSESFVQAQSIEGDIHFHSGPGHGGPGHDFPPPRQLPAGPGRFVNRTSDLTELDRLLAGGSEPASPMPSVSVIIGAPGVGKTALALHWAHHARDHFPDGDLYIDMRGYGSAPPVSPEQALDSFLRALNVDPEQIPIELEERAALYRSALARKNILVVIDNVTSARQIRYLLPGSDRCLVLVTSRSRLSSLVVREGATRVNLDVLSPADSVRLLAEFVGEERVESDGEGALQVAALCSYLPLALRVVAERAAARQYLSLRELVRELLGEQSRLDALASEEDELTNVRAVFSWSYRALPPEQQRAFRLLGLHEGAEFGSAVAAALIDVPLGVVGRLLHDLAGVHLVQEVGPDRFRLHDLLRAYSVERLQREVPQRERTHAVRRMFDWYLLAADLGRQAILPHSHAVALVPSARVPAPPFRAVEDAMSWFESERLNLLGVLKQAMDLGHYDIAWKLPVVSDGFFELRSYWPEWKQIHVDGLLAAQTIGDRLGEASNHLCLGDASWRVGTYDEALAHYERAASIAGAVGDRWLEGFSSRGIGLIHQERGDTGTSIEYFTRALEIFRSSALARGEGMALLSLGKAHRALRDARAAVDHCERAVAIFERIGDTWSQAWGLLPLADAAGEAGDPASAERHLRRALSIFRAYADRRSEALALDSLGTVRHDLGDDEGARGHWTVAAEVFDQLGDERSAPVRAKLAALDNE